MSRTYRETADPFGFMAAINWDVVSDNADAIHAIFNGNGGGKEGNGNENRACNKSTAD